MKTCIKEYMMKPDLEILHNRLLIQYFKDRVWYASEDHFVHKSLDNGKTWITACQLEKKNLHPFEAVKNLILRNRLVRPFRRNVGISNLLVLQTGTIVAQYDHIYRCSNESALAQKVFDLENIRAPLKNGLTVDDETGYIYFGEYNINRPYAVKIFRGTDDGKNWEVCHQFPEGAVRHVHAIVPDPYRKRLWICTGDSDQESGLFYTDDDFQSVHLFLGGSQMYRMITLFPFADCLVWGSDAGKDAPDTAINYMYRYDFKTGQVVQLTCVDKPVYYSMQLSDGALVVGTTYEVGIRRHVDKSADIWISSEGKYWEKIFSFPYKPAGRKYRTKYSTVNFPKGDRPETIVCTPENTDNYDFKTVRIGLCTCP